MKMAADHEQSRTFTQYLSPLGAWAFALGTSVGWGALVITSNTYLSQAGPAGSIAGILLGAAIMLIVGRSYHYMMNCIPDAGGVYAYARESFGYDHGFLNAWFLALTYISMFWANATALPLFAEYFLGGVFRFGFHYTVFGYEVYLGEALLSIAAILLSALICSKSRKITARLTIGMVLLFTVGIGVSAVLSLGRVGAEGEFAPAPVFLPGRSPFWQILHIACISPWAYIGFENISHSTEEFRFPRKKSFRLLAGAIGTALALYVLIFLLSVAVYPPQYDNWLSYIRDLDSLQGFEALPVFYAVNRCLGRPGTIALTVSLLALILTSLIGNMTALSRLLYAMAKDDVIPRRFSSLSEKSIPAKAIWLIAALSTAVPFLGRSAIGWIVDVTTIGATILFGFVSASAWKTARARGDRLEKWNGMTGVALMVIIALYLLLFNLLSSESMEAESYFLFTVWAVLGFFFFTCVLKKDYTKKFGRSTVVWIALLLLGLFTSLIWMNQSAMNSARQSMEDVRVYFSGDTAPYAAEDQTFMELEMRELRYANVRSMIVVVLLFAVSLGIHLLLQKKQETLEREKMRAEEGSRAKSRFLFNMSHDIRTPMNAIIGFTHLARQPGVTQAEKDEYLSKIERSGAQLLGIINDVLDMSRIENGRIELLPAPMNLHHALDEVQLVFTHQMKEKGIEFTADSAAVRHPHVLCDKNRFSRILLNLIGNACKFTPEGGRVTAVISETGSDGERADYEIRIRDTGIGMSREFIEHMFTPFERERTSTVSGIQGTGLGLSITHGIVEMMHGTIDVASAPGEGTEFLVRLTLPLTEAEEETEAETETLPPSRLDTSSIRLLLVEDNEINLEIASMILSQEGFLLETAGNGQLAVDMVASSQPGHYDAILMDIQMPVMNGYEATRAIRALPDAALSGIPIIAMTANVFQEDVQAAEDAGMNGHIAKPLDVEKMMAALTAVLEEHKKPV